jgi:hypothetical protein
MTYARFEIGRASPHTLLGTCPGWLGPSVSFGRAYAEPVENRSDAVVRRMRMGEIEFLTEGEIARTAERVNSENALTRTGPPGAAWVLTPLLHAHQKQR